MKDKDTKVPEIRFQGFTDAWEQRKLGDIYVERNNQGDNSLQILSVSIHHGISNGELDSGTLGKQVRRSEDKSLYKRVYSGDLVFNMMRAWQGAIGVTKTDGMVSPAYITAIPNEQIYPPFMDYCLRRPNIISQINNLSYGVTDFRKRLYWNSFIRISCCMPLIPEQIRITSIFDNFDHLITLHKRKLDGLKELKRGYLQRMFPQTGENVPRVRFAGFNEPWQERTLGDVVERVTRKNKGLKSTLTLTISAQHGLIAQKDFFDKDVASKDVSNYYLVKNGEFAYNKSYSNGYPWGAVKRLDKYEMGVLSTLYIVFKPTNIDSEFLVQYYETTHWHNKVAQYAAEGARNHGLLNIATSDFFETVLAIPTDSNEQAAIGNFFRMLDGQIIAQEQKLNQLKQLKSAYLQNMFI